MTELTTILAILAVVYLCECCIWRNGNAVTFTGSRGTGWRHHLGPSIVLRRDAGVLFLDPLPPLQWAFRIAGDANGRAHRCTDPPAISARVAESLDAARRLRWACTALFFLVFVAIPLAVYQFGLLRAWLPLLLALLPVLAFVDIEFWAVHRRLHPDKRAERIETLITIVVSPLGAIRAFNAATRDSLADCDPVAVSYVLCERDAFHRVARLAYVDSRRSEAAGSHAPGLRAASRDRLERFLVATGTLGRVTAAPEPEGTMYRAYCPRCLGQYTRAEGDCSDCPGIPLTAFDAATPNSEGPE